mgnify:CR=1 FL=1
MKDTGCHKKAMVSEYVRLMGIGQGVLLNVKVCGNNVILEIYPNILSSKRVTLNEVDSLCFGCAAFKF